MNLTSFTGWFKMRRTVINAGISFKNNYKDCFKLKNSVL